MNIAISLLLEKADALSEGSCRWESVDSLNINKRVSGVGFLDGEVEPWDENLLYVAASEDAASAVAPSYAVCLAPEGLSSVSAYSFLVAAFERCRSWYQDCMSSICLGDEVEDILRSATSELRNPVAFVDEKGALAYRTGRIAASARGTIWDGLLSRSYIDLDYFTEAEQKSLIQRINERQEIIAIQPALDSKHRVIIIPLFAEDMFCGSVTSADVNEPFTSSQVELLRLAAHLAFLAAIRGSRETGILRGAPYYVDRLLRGATVQEGTVVRQFESMGWKPEDSYLLYRFEAADAESGIINMYQNRLKQVLPDALWLHYQGGLVALEKRNNADGPDQIELHNLNNLLGDTRIWCGISSCATGFMTLQFQHTQCELALRAPSVNDDTHVVSFGELYPDILRNVLNQSLDARCLCHPAVLRLAESGRQQDAVRLETLKSFLLNGRSVAAASRSLDIHRNTLLYRLEKLQEEIGTDLYNMDNSLLTWLLLSCLIVS